MKFSLLTSASSLALGAGVLLSLSGTAQAGLTCTVTSCTETVYTNGDAYAPTNWTAAGSTLQPVTLDTFVPVVTLATHQVLKSVVITEGGSLSATGTLTNTGTAGTFSVGVLGKLGLVGTGSTPSSFPTTLKILGNPTTSITLAAGTKTPQSQGYTLFASIATASQTLNSSLSQYENTVPSTFTVDFSATASSVTGGGANLTNTISTGAIGNLAVTYNFTTSSAVPEPASLALLGAGMAGLGVIRRRRKV